MVSAMAQFGNRKEAFSPARDALKGDETSLSYHRHKRYNRYNCDNCDKYEITFVITVGLFRITGTTDSNVTTVINVINVRFTNPLDIPPYPIHHKPDQPYQNGQHHFLYHTPTPL